MFIFRSLLICLFFAQWYKSRGAAGCEHTSHFESHCVGLKMYLSPDMEQGGNVANSIIGVMCSIMILQCVI